MAPLDPVFQEIFDHAAVGIAQIALDGTFVRVNERYCQMLGYSRADLLSKTVRDINPPDTNTELLSGCRQLQAGVIASRSVEKRYVRKDGTDFWGRLHLSLVRNHEGLPHYFVAVVEDVTEKVKVELALREKERELALAQSAAQLGLWNRDLRSNVTQTSGFYARLRGQPYETAQVTHEEWLAGIHPDDRQRVGVALRECVQRKQLWNEEFRVVWPDGSVHWLLAKGQVLLDNEGQPTQLAGVSLDITERKNSEAFHREIEQQYKEVFDNISVCMFLIDVAPEGRFRFVGFNAAEEQAVGLSSAQTSGKFVEEVFAEDLAAKLNGNYRRCLNAGHAIQFDDALDLPHGRRYFHTNLIPLRNADGIIKRIIGACIDTTDLRRTQEESLAKQNLESLGVLAGGIAHDFNNVLGGIYSQAELIEADLADGSELSAEMQKIKSAALRGSEIVRELMVYAGQDEARIEEPIDLSSLIRETLSLIRLSISKHAVLKTVLGTDLPAISGNPPKIRQVLMNLIINASEAIGTKGGTITVATEYVKCQGNATNAQAEYIRLEVSDTGDGIPDDAKARIFDPFFTTKFAGRGMGLAVVNKVVHDHGGAISVSSALARGTTFSVLLPCRSARRTENLIGASGDWRLEPPQKTTLLVADDEDLLRTAISKSLRQFGFSVLEARSGSEAMTLIRANRDELKALLLDVTLPGISSREIVEEVRKIRPDLKILVTSAYSKETVDRTFQGLQIEHFIRKPFPIGDLKRLLTLETAGVSGGV